jgi:hypothetical protein
VTSTVQIPEGVTLTIEPGVVIETAPGVKDMFLVHGTINALGNSNARITFDGNAEANFFSAKSSPGSMLVHVEYAHIKDGKSLWPPTGYPQYGHLVLRHSIVENLSYFSYIWYPEQDVYIEYNVFINSMGFSIGHGAHPATTVKVYVRGNRFVSLGNGFSEFPAWVGNWASYADSKTIVSGNVFENIPAGKYALYLPPGEAAAAMDGTGNFWGTTDRSYVQSKIFDQNDDISAAGMIPFEPVLEAEPPGVPSAPNPTPTATPTPSPTPTPTPTPTPSPSPSSTPSDYERSVSLEMERHVLLRSQVRGLDLPSFCYAETMVFFQRKMKRGWKNVQRRRTDLTGSVAVNLEDGAGLYRAVVVDASDGISTCLSARSPERRHRHRRG